MRPFLRPVSWLYGQITEVRNRLYDHGVFKSHSLGAKTISIGNITTGGTGKTPLVGHVAEILAEAGERVCILTRGYGRQSSGRVLVSDGENILVDAHEGGDEPVELARKLIGKAIVVADADRVPAAAWAKEKFGVTAFVLDDGFQHRRAKRDLDIVCIDATRSATFTTMLPAGRLREPVKNLRRADAIIVTRCELVQGIGIHIVGLRITSSVEEIFEARSEIKRIASLQQFLGSDGPQWDPNTATLAFCGLGNPDVFFQSLNLGGFFVERTEVFPDHYVYRQADIDRLANEARQNSAKALITTAKDAVKLKGLKFDIPCYVVEIETVIDDPARFRDLVLSA